MRVQVVFALTTVLAAANASAVKRADAPCYTVESGYFTGLKLDGSTYRFGLDLHHNMVSPDKGAVKSFKVNYQKCPANSSSRILLQESTHTGPNTCLTITNANSSSPPWYAKGQKCVGGARPPNSQYFYGTSNPPNNFEGVQWGGSETCSGGWYLYTGTGAPVVTQAEHIVKLGCGQQGAGTGALPFRIVP